MKITLVSYQNTCESTKIKQRQNISWNSFLHKIVFLIVPDMVSGSYPYMLLLDINNMLTTKLQSLFL